MLPIITRMPMIRNKVACRKDIFYHYISIVSSRFQSLDFFICVLSYPDLLDRLHRLFLHQFDVEGGGQDEDQHSGSRRTCRRTQHLGHTHAHTYSCTRFRWHHILPAPTNESKNVSDGGGEDDQNVDGEEEDDCNDDVPCPAEVFRRAYKLVDGGSNLKHTKVLFSTLSI